MPLFTDDIRIPPEAEAEVTIVGSNGWEVTVLARLDTGASMSSIDSLLADALQLEVVGSALIKNSLGKERRDVVSATIIYDSAEYDGRFNIADRSRLRYPLLLGRDLLFAE
jgi:hypothetical protein